jgi:hypothetical protein
MVAASQDKSLKLFATKVKVGRLHIDLNKCPSPHDAMTLTQNVTHDDPVKMNDMSQPPFSQQIDVEMEVNKYILVNYVILLLLHTCDELLFSVL